jgi:hypothetical protein
MGKGIMEIIFYQHRVSFYDAVGGVGDHYVYAIACVQILPQRRKGAKGAQRELTFLNEIEFSLRLSAAAVNYSVRVSLT